MKKLMIALAFAAVGTAANAQTASIEAPSKYTVATNSFWDNWYLQVGVDMGLANPYGAKSWGFDVFPNGKSFGVDLAVGKWFTPGIGTRLKVQWENGAIRQNHNIWTPRSKKGGYATVNFDTQFNLSNLFCGFNENRVWNTIFYTRGGLLRNFDSDYYGPMLGLGWENTWKVARKVKVYLDASYNIGPSEIMEETAYYVYGRTPGKTIDGTKGKPGYISSRRGRFGNAFINIDLGVQFDLGKNTWDKAVSLEDYNALAASSEEALARLRADLDREKQVNADLRAQLAKWANHKCPEVGTDKIIQGVATSVFFDLNSTKINSKKDLINLESLANAVKKAGAKVLVTGSADSKTGSAPWNQKLSEGRANTVADKLVELGVPRANIEVKAVGGINEVSPYPLNRRALVFVK